MPSPPSPRLPGSLDKVRRTRSRRRVLACLSLCLTSVLVWATISVAKRLPIALVESISDAEPELLPNSKPAADAMKRFRAKWDASRPSTSMGRPAAPLSLDSNDLNALLSGVPGLAGRVQVLGIDGDNVRARISLPLNELGLAGVRDRHVNGVATLGLDVEGGRLVVVARSIETRSGTWPPALMERLQRQNLARLAFRDRSTLALLKSIGRMKVGDGRVTVNRR